jgi:UPF0271 protein
LTKRIDLNSDMGEGYGVWNMGHDLELLNYISSTNIACGWHAGDARRMRNLVTAAAAKNVHIGAHPGLPDLNGFGRREMAITAEDAYDFVMYQTGALQAFVLATGAKLHHVKPHGALYNQAANNLELARGIARAVHDLGDGIILYGLASSCFVQAAAEFKVPLWQEVFADRRYLANGLLVPRSNPRAVLTDEAEAQAQAIALAHQGTVQTIDGTTIQLQADTLCIHGDNPHALIFAKAIAKQLRVEG